MFSVSLLVGPQLIHWLSLGVDTPVNCTVVPLYLWGFQDPRWMVDTVASTEFYVYDIFPIQIHLKESLYIIRHSESLTKLIVK